MCYKFKLNNPLDIRLTHNLVINGLIWVFMALDGEYCYFLYQSSDIWVTLHYFIFFLNILNTRSSLWLQSVVECICE